MSILYWKIPVDLPLLPYMGQEDETKNGLICAKIMNPSSSYNVKCLESQPPFTGMKKKEKEGGRKWGLRLRPQSMVKQ